MKKSWKTSFYVLREFVFSGFDPLKNGLHKYGIPLFCWWIPGFLAGLALSNWTGVDYWATIIPITVFNSAFTYRYLRIYRRITDEAKRQVEQEQSWDARLEVQKWFDS